MMSPADSGNTWLYGVFETLFQMLILRRLLAAPLLPISVPRQQV